MVVARPLCVITAFVLCHMTMGKLAEQCCKSQESIFGMMLKGFVFKKIRVSSPIECLQACNADFRCHSFNYVFAQDMCELNNRTKEARPANFLKDFDRYYFERNTKAVQLGSIPELPAISCKEIKASDGERGVSGNYWFDSVIPGKTILLYCDMDIVDADECKNSSIPVCHSNAACHNTIGSFVCSCVLGFYGNGRTCQDIDECVSSPCDKNAACQNTLGSYVCICNSGYAGDGKRCGDEVQPVPIQVPSVKPDPEKPNPKLGVGQIAFSGDNRYLATKNDNMPNAVWLWDVSKLCLAALLLQSKSVKAFQWDPKQPRLAICTANNKLYMWSPAGCVSVVVPTEVPFQVTSLQFHPDGNLLMLMSKDQMCLCFLTNPRT